MYLFALGADGVGVDEECAPGLPSRLGDRAPAPLECDEGKALLPTATADGGDRCRVFGAGEIDRPCSDITDMRDPSRSLMGAKPPLGGLLRVKILWLFVRLAVSEVWSHDDGETTFMARSIADILGVVIDVGGVAVRRGRLPLAVAASNIVAPDRAILTPSKPLEGFGVELPTLCMGGVMLGSDVCEPL